MERAPRTARTEDARRPAAEGRAVRAPGPGLTSEDPLRQLIRTGPAATAQRKDLETLFGDAAPWRARSGPAADGGLPLALRAATEALSGVALGGVRVHYNSSEPARLKAQAFAQGADIHLAPGQERHLPHETWHVVQQAQGRVRPTAQMPTLHKNDGVAINDEAGLEREADVMGARAAALAHSPTLTTSALSPSAAPAAPAVAQRAVGFEWEVEALKLKEVTKKGDRGEPASLPSKAVAYRRGGVRLEVDSGHGEFVTEPAETMNQVEAQLGVIGQVVEDLRSHEGGLYMTAPGQIVFTDNRTGKLGQVWMETGDWTHAQILGKTVTGSFQATAGVEFTARALLTELTASIVNYDRPEKTGWEKDLAGAAKTASESARSGKVQALILAVEYFIAACKGGSPTAEDGPKTWMPLLLRTDFRSMFHAIPDKEQPEFVTWAGTHPKKDQPLCPQGYRIPGGTEKGPSIGDWLISIHAGRRRASEREADKDLMSPPPGFTPHLTSSAKAADAEARRPVADPIPYAMGLYGLDGDRIIAEHRQPAPHTSLTSSAVGYSDMARLARTFATEHLIPHLPDPTAKASEDDEDRRGEVKEGVVKKAAVADRADRPVDTSKRAWYGKLCAAAETTMVVYGKGMADYSKVRQEPIYDLGAARLTREHYALFDLIRARRPAAKFDPAHLAHVYKTYATPELRIANYTV